MRYHILCSVIYPGVLTYAILMESDVMVLLSEMCLLKNRIMKNELIQKIQLLNPVMLEKQ